MKTIYPVIGSVYNEASIRGRVYDTAGAGEILDRGETLAAYDAGTLTARKIVHRQSHPSYNTRQDKHGNIWMDSSGSVATMTRDELVALFDAADAVLRSLEQ